MAPEPGVLPLDSCLMAVMTSVSVDGVSRERLTPACGVRSIASSVISDRRFRTYLKCSTHL